MSENMVCDKCGPSRQELQKHEQHCAGKGAQQQSGKDRPMTRGAGSASMPTE